MVVCVSLRKYANTHMCLLIWIWQLTSSSSLMGMATVFQYAQLMTFGLLVAYHNALSSRTPQKWLPSAPICGKKVKDNSKPIGYRRPQLGRGHTSLSKLIFPLLFFASSFPQERRKWWPYVCVCVCWLCVQICCCRWFMRTKVKHSFLRLSFQHFQTNSVAHHKLRHI